MGHEGRALKNEIDALMREAPGRSLTLPPREATMRGYATRKSALTRPCEHPDLGLPVSRTEKQLSVVYKPFSPWHFVRQLEWTDTARFMKTLGIVKSQGKLQSGPVSTVGEHVEQQELPHCWWENDHFGNWFGGTLQSQAQAELLTQQFS